MDKFEKKEIKYRTFTKNTWYDWCDWLINYIPQSIKKQWVVTISINFISFKDVHEELIIHAKSNKIKFMSYDNVNGF